MTSPRHPGAGRVRRRGAPGRRGHRLAVAVVAAGVLVCSGGFPVLAAGWTNTASVAHQVTAAAVSSTWQSMGAVGAVSLDGTRYELSSLVTRAVGYVDLVNTSTVPATLTLDVAMGTLVGATPVSVCSQPWAPATGACAGATTLVGLTLVAGTSTGRYVSPAPLPPGGRVAVKIDLHGVAAAVTLSRVPVVTRAAADRTAA